MALVPAPVVLAAPPVAMPAPQDANEKFNQPARVENVDVIRVLRGQFHPFGVTAEEAEARAQLIGIEIRKLPLWASQAAFDRFSEGTEPEDRDRKRGLTIAEAKAAHEAATQASSNSQEASC